MNISILRLLLIIIALIGCAFAWTSAAPAALTLNAYDLAEWTSLHPAVRGGSPPLLTTGLLRLPLLCLIGLLAWNAPPRGISRSIVLILAALISVGMLPPLEILTDFTNANYRQQLLWSLLGLTITSAAFSRIGTTIYPLLSLAASLLMLICSIVGIQQALDLIRGFAINANLGLGVWITSFSVGVFIVVQVAGLTFARRHNEDLRTVQAQTR